MDRQRYTELSRALLAHAQGIQDAKSPGYTVVSRDVLANFKRVADRASVSEGQAWAVYFLKHIDALTTIMTRPEAPISEAPIGRFSDAINYLFLGWALFVEREWIDGAPVPGGPVDLELDLTEDTVRAFERQAAIEPMHLDPAFAAALCRHWLACHAGPLIEDDGDVPIGPTV